MKIKLNVKFLTANISASDIASLITDRITKEERIKS